jgi:hypothetical protein
MDANPTYRELAAARYIITPMTAKATLAFAALTLVDLNAVDRATVPLLVEGNRPFVNLSFRKPDGSVRNARFWVDTGGGGFILTQSLATDLGLKPIGEPLEEDGRKFVQVQPPRAWIGDFELDLTGSHSLVSEPWPGMLVEGLLPGAVLKNHEIVLDYPKGRFTIAKPGELTPQGAKFPAPVATESGFPRIELEIDGEKFGFLLDTGAAFTMISKLRFDAWMQKHPDWPRRVGAFGHANMTMGADAMNWIGRLDGVRLGSILLGPLEVVTRQPGIYEEWMSKEMTAPIVGAVAGNVLKQFRVEIHYAESVVYLQGRPDPHSAEFNALPWTVGRDKGAWLVVAAPESSGAKWRDEIVTIDGAPARDFSLSEIQRALMGRPGSTKKVTLRRGAEQINLNALVTRGL